MTDKKMRSEAKKVLTGIAVVILILVLINITRINIKDKIDLSSTATVYIVEEEVFGEYATDFYSFSADDHKYNELSSLLKKTTYRKHFIQDTVLYGHENNAASITIKYYNEHEDEQVSITLYSDGICIIDGKFVNVSGKVYEQLWNIIYSE